MTAADVPPVRRARATVVAIALAVVLLAAILVSALVGQLQLSPAEVGGAILRALGIPVGEPDRLADQTLWAIRFPRIVMAMGVGAALATAGAVMQSVFGNPLAEPGVVGVSSGAALGAGIAIVLGLGSATALGGSAIALCAFAGGLLATALVYFAARAHGRAEVVTLLLTGIAVNAFAGAGLALVLFAANAASREQIVFWQLGSLSGSLWTEAGIVFPVAVFGIVIATLLARRYDLLALGERNARHLGVNVERLRIGSIILVAVLTGAAVAFVGIISFLGLVVPHAIRLAVGPAHRSLIPLSALGGAVLLLLADLVARTLVAGAELPIGLLTSLVGGPFFLVLLHRQRVRSGGWA